jgi:hypothetical protein
MPTFQLFRIKVETPPQLALTDPHEPKARLIGRAIEERPTLETGWGHKWHLGDLHELGPGGSLYFRIGKTTKTRLGAYDESTGHFVEVEQEDTPYTHVVAELNYQICAIAPNTKVGRNERSIAGRLEAILNLSTPAVELGYQFFVLPVPNPNDFLGEIRSAYAVTRFWFRFRAPNFFDRGEFEENMEQYLRHVRGDTGKVEVQGDELDRHTIEDTTRSAVAAGEEVSATIQRYEGAEGDTIRIGDTPVVVEQESVADEDERRNLVERVIARFLEVRDRAAS